MDVFFVISGYLITKIIGNEMNAGTFTFVDFYARRFRRLLPAFLTVVISIYILSWKALLPDEFANLGKHIWATSGFSENLLLWKESGYFDAASETKPFLHFWSLGVEEQFYLYWPSILLLTFHLRLKPKYYLILLYAVSLSLSITQVHHDLSGTFYSLTARFWELLTGAMIFFYETKKVAPKFSAILAEVSVAVGLVTLIAGAFFIDSSFLYPSYWALIPTLGAAVIILFGRQSKLAGLILGNRLFIGIGLISYPLYLWHWPLLSILRIVENSVLKNKLIWESVALSFLLATLTYLWIEKPIQRRLSFKNNKTKARKLVFVSLGLLLISSTVGFVTWKAEGFPIRIQIAGIPFEPFTDLKPWLDPFIGKSNCPKIECHDPSCICHQPEREDAQIAVWGDSHAWAIAYGLENLKIPFLMMIQPTCLPLVGVQSHFGPEKTDQCFNSGENVVQFLREKQNIKTVILVAMDVPYLTGMRDGKLTQLFITDHEPGNSDSPHIFLAGYRRTLNALTAANKQVIVYIDNPEFVVDLDPHSCTSYRPLRFSSVQKPSCNYDRSSFEEFRKPAQKIFETLQVEFPKVTFFKSYDQLCDVTTCFGVIDSKRMYSDGDHLSAAGGIRMVKAMREFLPPDLPATAPVK